MELRDYQVDAVSSVVSAFDSVDSTLLVAATGAGKTVMALEIARTVIGNGRCLFLCHRDELLFQPARAIMEHFPELRPFGIVGRGIDKEWDDRPKTAYAAKFICVTVQTIQVRPGVLDEITAHGPIDLVIIDETHRYSQEYTDIIERLR